MQARYVPLSCQKQEERVPDRGYFILTSKQIMKQFVGLFGCVFFLSTFHLFLQTSSFPGEVLKWPHL